MTRSARLIAPARILSPKQIPALARRLRAQGEKIVFTNGCFDLLHPGHVSLLAFAKSKGDVLIVAVNSDRSVRRLKGNTRPVMKLADRLKVLSSIRFVDYLVPFSDPTPESLVQAVLPDVLIKGADWSSNRIAGSEYAKKVLRFPLVSGVSTTKIIEKIRKV